MLIGRSREVAGELDRRPEAASPFCHARIRCPGIHVFQVLFHLFSLAAHPASDLPVLARSLSTGLHDLDGPQPDLRALARGAGEAVDARKAVLLLHQDHFVFLEAAVVPVFLAFPFGLDVPSVRVGQVAQVPFQARGIPCQSRDDHNLLLAVRVGVVLPFVAVDRVFRRDILWDSHVRVVAFDRICLGCVHVRDRAEEALPSHRSVAFFP